MLATLPDDMMRTWHFPGWRRSAATNCLTRDGGLVMIDGMALVLLIDVPRRLNHQLSNQPSEPQIVNKAYVMRLLLSDMSSRAAAR
jgi:hypothetical protein